MTLVLLLHVATAKAQTMFPNPQAIWTADNNTLTFVDYEGWYVPGNTFNGHTVTAVWYGSDYDPYGTESASAPAWNSTTPAWNSTVSATLTTVVFDDSFQDISPTNCCKWFANCQSLQTITGIENLNTSEVTNMSEMFYDCRALTSLDLSNFNTSNVTNMEGMFFNCNSLTSLDVSSFNTSNVTDMGSMFQECSSLTSLDVTNFVTSNVTNMECMFQDCSSLTSLDLSNFNTSSVVNMRGMFDTCSGLTSLDLSNFDTSNVTEMGNMFLDCSSLTTIVCNNTWTPTSSTNMFAGCTSLVGGLGTAFDSSHVDAEYARLDDTFIPGYFTAKRLLAYEAQAIWTEGDATLTFVSSHHFYGPGETFNGKTVTKCYPHYKITDTGTSSPDWLSTVRSDLTKVVFHSSFASVRPRSLAAWFSGCSKLNEIEGISNLNTSEATSMSNMFYGCSALTSLDLSNFDTSNVTTMSGMFNNCSSLTSLDVSNFDTRNVKNMGAMFQDCSSLTSLDLTNFDTRKVTAMYYMFRGCSALTTIICDSTWKQTSSSNMFLDCTSLVGGLGTRYDATHVDAAYAHPDGGTTNPGYFTSSTEVITANKPDDKETYWATYYYSGCNTVALPAEGQNVKIYTAADYNYSEEEGQRTLILTEVTDGVIMAGEGVIIESNQPNVTVRHTTQVANESFYENNYLDGCDVETEVDDLGVFAQIYTMGAIDTDNDGIRELGFYKFAGSKLKARRAYLTLLDEFIPIEEEEGGEAGIRIRFADEDMATGIDTSTKDKVQSTTIYDLQGRRVVNPTKGIYIVNGKKVYMK